MSDQTPTSPSSWSSYLLGALGMGGLAFGGYYLLKSRRDQVCLKEYNKCLAEPVHETLGKLWQQRSRNPRRKRRRSK